MGWAKLIKLVLENAYYNNEKSYPFGPQRPRPSWIISRYMKKDLLIFPVCSKANTEDLQNQFDKSFKICFNIKVVRIWQVGQLKIKCFKKRLDKSVSFLLYYTYSKRKAVRSLNKFPLFFQWMEKLWGNFALWKFDSNVRMGDLKRKNPQGGNGSRLISRSHA